MSEHPHVRRRSGPVGELQAELADARTTIARLRPLSDILQAQLADPERIRREAIGAWVLAHPPAVWEKAEPYVHHLLAAVDNALAAGESAVTGGQAQP